jgi:hypothetical protein
MEIKARTLFPSTVIYYRWWLQVGTPQRVDVLYSTKTENADQNIHADGKSGGEPGSRAVG